jgi:hypothetical protein
MRISTVFATTSLVLLTACGSSKSSGGGGTISPVTSNTTPPGSTTPGSTTPPASSPGFFLGRTGGTSISPPLNVPASTQAELDSALAATWTALQPTIDAALAREIQKLAGMSSGKLKVNSISILKKDLTSSPRLVITNTGATTVQVQVFLPAGTWEVELAAQLEYDVSVGGLTIPIQIGATVDVQNIQGTEALVLDTTDPTLPVCSSVGKIQLNYNLDLSSTGTLSGPALTVLKPLIDTFVSGLVQAQLANFDALLAGLAGQPVASKIWGLGAPPRTPFGQQPDLEKAALAVSDDIQAVHVPYGGVVTAYMSDPTYGQGTPTHWEGYGDSAIWTGHYLAGETFRYAVTKDPKAQANAAKAIAAIEDMLDAETPGGGHLARCVVSATSPDAATLLQDPDAFASTVRGQSVVCLGHISRDQYLGIMHGLACAYDYLDDLGIKQDAGSLMTRVVDYLVANGWIAMEHDNVTMSAPFLQSPEKMIMFTALAAHVDPAKYQALRDQVGQLAWMTWVLDVPSALDPLGSYYKWNLGEGAMYESLRLETDPNRFMALMEAHAIDRRVIGHHENAYFQTIDTAIDPTLAATTAPEILDELRRFVSRGRRDFTVTNSTDPSIAQGTYSAALSVSGGTLAKGSSTEALYPVPVEKRCSTDFLWQRDPFSLDETGDPKRQAPGVDLVLPYWMARYYKLVP